jgi:hypothetical protein
MEKALRVKQVPAEALVDILAALEREKTDTSAGAMTAEEACGPHADGYIVQDAEGRNVAAYLLTFQNCAKKRVCWVNGAYGRAPGHDLTAEVMPIVEKQAREGGAHQIAVMTKRMGLAKKICADGFQETGRIYRKNLQ